MSKEGYHNLAVMTANRQLCLFRIKPKLHMQLHLVSLASQKQIQSLSSVGYVLGLEFRGACAGLRSGSRLWMKHQIDDGASFVLSILCQQVAIQYRFCRAPAGIVTSNYIALSLRRGCFRTYIVLRLGRGCFRTIFCQSRCSLLVGRRFRGEGKPGHTASTQLHGCH